MRYLFLFIIIVLSLLGTLEVIRLFCYSITSPPEKAFTLLVKLRDENDCEYIIESLIERIKWNSMDFDVLLLYDGENPAVKDIAEKLISKYHNIRLSTYEDLNYNHIIN